MMRPAEPGLGATYLGDGQTHFLVWAPFATTVDVRMTVPTQREVRLKPMPRGYHAATVDDVQPGYRYTFVLDGTLERPDPASRSQPEGVHRPSEVIDPSEFSWTDQGWCGLPLRDLVIYELHVGTLSDAGTFLGVIPYLDGLRDLGITAIEIMPVAQFPGERNWGYDGVYPFAVQNSYGGAEGLARLVDACHQRGLAVVLDVVYNHLGPEGNYLGDFGPYFTERYHTPWGAALNFDGPHSDEVRRYFIENACYWIDTLHIDALRLDAVHTIFDRSAHPFLQELSESVNDVAERRNKRVHLIAESDLNDPRLVRPPLLGGYGLSAQWNDDFHHAVDALLTGARSPYRRDFGTIDHLARAYRDGFVYSGQYSQRRQRRFGAPLTGVEAQQLVIFVQNHDQVGNRVDGERLATLTSFDGLRLAAAATILSPYVPLLFMGEEYGETTPFHYFTSHTDPDLVTAVREGRQREFAEHWDRDAPDPQDPTLFVSSRLRRDLADREPHRQLVALYRELLTLRREFPSLAHLSRGTLEVTVARPARVLLVHRWHGPDATILALNFDDQPATVLLPVPGGNWHKRLDTASPTWGGSGSRAPDSVDASQATAVPLPPRAAVLYHRQIAKEAP
nr:MAG: malto-oligosyltrehalose trehalohydrolase [Sphaerobacter thermophilus]